MKIVVTYEAKEKDLEAIRKSIDSALKKDDRVLVTVEKYVELLSDRQRWYYFWVVVSLVQKHHGFDTQEEAHFYVKQEYLPEYEWFLKSMWGDDLNAMLKRFLSIYHDLTITNQNKGEFERFLSRVRLGESRQGLYIPLPNETQWWDTAYLIT